jgi:hypothetical protein
LLSFRGLLLGLLDCLGCRGGSLGGLLCGGGLGCSRCELIGRLCQSGSGRLIVTNLCSSLGQIGGGIGSVSRNGFSQLLGSRGALVGGGLRG